jgi:hypothetical protein
MTVEIRLEALERGQTEILTGIGDMREVIGRLDGTVSSWIDERRELQRQAELLCQQKHEAIEGRLALHDTAITDHHTRIKTIEGWKNKQVIGWSTMKKLWVGIAAFAATVGTTLGIAEVIAHWMV